MRAGKKKNSLTQDNFCTSEANQCKKTKRICVKTSKGLTSSLTTQNYVENMDFNLTISELKLFNPHLIESPLVDFNLTISELKFEQSPFFYNSKLYFNLTISELKLKTMLLLSIKNVKLQSHHIGIEIIGGYGSSRGGVRLQSHHIGIEITEITAKQGERNALQSHHIGIEIKFNQKRNFFSWYFNLTISELKFGLYARLYVLRGNFNLTISELKFPNDTIRSSPAGNFNLTISELK